MVLESVVVVYLVVVVDDFDVVCVEYEVVECGCGCCWVVEVLVRYCVGEYWVVDELVEFVLW